MNKFLRLTWPTGAVQIVPQEALAPTFDYYLKDGEVGEVWELEVIEMTQEEYDALPEFTGP